MIGDLNSLVDSIKDQVIIWETSPAPESRSSLSRERNIPIYL